MSSPASKRVRLSASRTSLSGRTSLQGGQSSLPRPTGSISVTKLNSTQPTYDFITGAEIETPKPLKRTSLRQSQVFRHDNTQDENLRAKINSLEYELKNLQQERGLLVLQHDKELRELQSKADTDFKKYQTSESAAQKATQRCESLGRELHEVQDQSINDKASLERKLRDVQDQNTSLKEDAEDAQARLSDQDRRYTHQLKDVEAKRGALQETLDEVRQEFQKLSTNLDNCQAQLVERKAIVESLETQILELRSHTGDSNELNVLQTQLSDQVTHIRSLETTNHEQSAELRRLRDSHRSVQVVEEQKRGLEIELQVMKDVQRQLGEAQIQREILEDEKRTWTTLLQQDEEISTYESPEAVVKALVQARIEYASLIDRLGNTESELLEKDELIKGLEAEKSTLREQSDKSKISQASTSDSTENKSYKRLDRQRTLAVKEVEYLRAQLKTFDTEETILMDNKSFDVQRSEQIKHLESLVDQYRAEIGTLHTELSKLESVPTAVIAEPRGTKRSAESEDAEDDSTSRLGPLLRKNKNLQVALQKTVQQSQLLATELQAAKSQLKSLRESSKIRVLELRDNPTANAETVKIATLKTLKEENKALLSQLRGDNLQGVKVVPVSTVDALKLDLQDMEKVVAEKEKRMRRQREIWQAKANEFRDVIASILGWQIQFLPNGKARLSSMFYGKRHEPDEDAEANEHYIIFDGDNGTMKISGGPNGAFGQELKELVDFWVKGKKEIPCFLAAATLEFFEKFPTNGLVQDEL